jgi:hypothetical protein
MANVDYEVNVSPDGHVFWFVSTGPNGSITKVVTMQPMERVGRYNMAMADVINGELDYDNLTNNNDMDRIFGAIAVIVRRFTNRYPASQINIKGSNPARTRLYRMKISNNLERITAEFNVYGAIDNRLKFKHFRKGENYVAILVSRK